MKKTLLLSVVASTMIMAGGDIAPVEPVIETPMVAEASGWNFSGQTVAFTQTVDEAGKGSLFDESSTYAAVGAQLRAVNKDIFAGIGAGIELSGIHSDTSPASTNPASFNTFYNSAGNAGTTSAGVTQAYLTYGMGNTSLKLGRQTLPKSLSPLAYSEDWQMFKNTFDAALVVNSDVPNTTLVYVFLKNSNGSIGTHLNESSFNEVGTEGAHMITAQNKSIDGLTLTGTYYMAPDYTVGNDLSAIWADAKFKISDYTVALQGGQLDLDGTPDATTAFGAKVGGNFGMFGASLAYSTVSEGVVAVSNLGGVKSPLYTQMLLNNVANFHAQNADFIKVSANVKALGGKFTLSYGQALELRDRSGLTDTDLDRNPSEIDLMYKTKLTDNVTAFVAYANTDPDVTGEDANNFIRVWARYNFN